MKPVSHGVHHLVERLGNLLRSEARHIVDEPGLQPVQLEVLNYLARCNRYSDTLLAVTEYMGLTKGTTSQTIKVLVREGYLTRQVDRTDNRVYHLKLTEKGTVLVNKAIPAGILRRASDQMPETEMEEIERQLRKLLFSLQSAHAMKTFGICGTCQHNQTLQDGYFCKLTQEPLSREDTFKICREHEFPTYSNP